MKIRFRVDVTTAEPRSGWEYNIQPSQKMGNTGIFGYTRSVMRNAGRYGGEPLLNTDRSDRAEPQLERAATHRKVCRSIESIVHPFRSEKKQITRAALTL